jgi:signal transduction histidine kinase
MARTVALDDATRDRVFSRRSNANRRLDRIVRDLLDLARLENGIGPLEVRVFTIGRVFEHVIQRHEQEVAQAGTSRSASRIDDRADQ